MSILLDALKKSEEQRQLGKVPDIHSPVEGPPPDVAGRRRWISWLLVSGIVLIVTWTAWRQFGPTDHQPASAPDSAQLVATPSDEAVEADVTGPAPRARIETPVNGAKAPGRSLVEELPSSDETVGSELTARSAKVSQQGEPRNSQVNKSFTAYQAPPESVAEESVAQERVPAPATAKDIEADPSKKRLADKQKPPGQVEPRVTEPISFWELPQSVRDGLPDLRITVLVFAERPEDRFLLVGGQRMVEKDEYQPGVVLDEIRRDGAVFLYRNYRFLVKG
jgi:general secretion pathway protein B